jgi:sugar phosphate isomerase/epimerase
MKAESRREFFKRSLTVGAAAMLAGPLAELPTLAGEARRSQMRLGLCTYLWRQDWDLPTLLANCEKTNLMGVELRTLHKHGVEPSLTQRQRQAVKKRFADSPITFVGIGTNECFDSPDPARLKRSMDAAKDFVRLSHDCGSGGVKVKPNDFHKEVPHEKTIEQIGKSLNELGAFAADFGPPIRLEIHGKCGELPVIKQIIDIADHPNVGLCWNCNPNDLIGGGLEYNFNLVKDRLGATTHVRELNDGKYPFQQLIRLLVGADYSGWVLLECHTTVSDRLAAIAEQRALFEKMVAAAL